MVNSISKDKVWDVLNNIPDPEIPSISIVDLGIIRNVQFDKKMVTITITPTYSGCPAISFIKQEIIQQLELYGVTNCIIETKLSPPWTTDWMSSAVKDKLKESGISPPSNYILCPQCESVDVEIISNFGSTACKALYKCIECKEPFHHFKQF